MSWFKVDDMLAFNAKVVTVGNEAMGLWVRAGAWCASQLKGGFIPDVMANAMRSPLANGCDIDALVSAGLWHKVDGGYEFHDWDHYQPSAEQEREKRQKRSDAGKRGAEARWGDGKRHSNANGNRMANGDATAMPPSRPVLKTSSEIASDPDTAHEDVDDHPRPEIIELCEHLAERVRTNGHKAQPGKRWHRACRLLLDVDGHNPDQVRRAIDWATADPFWSANIRSMQTLREKYSTLQAQAQRRGKAEPERPKYLDAEPPNYDIPDAVKVTREQFQQMMAAARE